MAPRYLPAFAGPSSAAPRRLYPPLSPLLSDLSGVQGSGAGPPPHLFLTVIINVIANVRQKSTVGIYYRLIGINAVMDRRVERRRSAAETQIRSGGCSRQRGVL